MKPVSFWVRRGLTVWALAFGLIAGAAFLRGREAQTALLESAIWASISTALFLATRLYNAYNNRPCAICRDTVEKEAPDLPSKNHST